MFSSLGYHSNPTYCVNIMSHSSYSSHENRFFRGINTVRKLYAWRFICTVENLCSNYKDIFCHKSCSDPRKKRQSSLCKIQQDYKSEV